MPLYLAQHGLSNSGEVDPERKLTEEGIRETERMAGMMRENGIPVRRIFHSGKTRARETAELFSRELHPAQGTAEMPGMNPKDDVEDFSKKLDFDRTLYVGHLPFMEKLAAYLLTGSAGRPVIRFRNSGVVCLERDPESGLVTLRWALVPHPEE